MTMYKLCPKDPGNPSSISYIFNLETGVQFSAEETNFYYQEYLAWLAEGNEPLPADEPEL